MPAYAATTDHSHLFPGSRLRILDLAEQPSSDVDLEIVFSDGVAVAAELHRGADDSWSLDVAAHATARGTAIVPKVWRVDVVADDGVMVMVRGRLESQVSAAL